MRSTREELLVALVMPALALGMPVVVAAIMHGIYEVWRRHRPPPTPDKQAQNRPQEEP